MVDMNVVEQKPLMMVSLKERLENLKKENKELGFRSEKVYVYLQEFVKNDLKTAEQIREKLIGLGISKLREKHIVKIIDTMPEDQESLKVLFAGESVSFKQEELKQILDVVNG